MNKNLEDKYDALKKVINEMEEVAIAFSGGVDSTFLLKVAIDVLGKDNVIAVTSCSETYPEKQLADAKKLAKEMEAVHIITYTSELENERFVKNDKMRCYYCKNELFSEVKRIAKKNGINNVLDGSNHDDYIHDYRPGLKAAAELQVKSPLKEVEMTKGEIRKLSNCLQLPTWNKPAFACLSSRFPYGDEITTDKLSMVDKAEQYLQKYKFNQLRVRHHDQNTARIEVTSDDMIVLIENKEDIISKLRIIGYIYITLDLQGYRTGSMNEVIDTNID